jgi:DNA-binding CsgD family transcriptional regulator
MTCAPIAAPNFAVPNTVPNTVPHTAPNSNWSALNYFANHLDQHLMHAMLEGWMDGIILLDHKGKLVHLNGAARQLCDRLSLAPDRSNSEQSIPPSIFHLYELLIDSQTDYPNQPIVLEDEIHLDSRQTVRARVRWVGMDETARPYVIIVLEDRYQSTMNRAIVEVDRYHLSPREAEVWTLYRTGHPYKQIASMLYITVDTVKKHLKSIRHKQQAAS